MIAASVAPVAPAVPVAPEPARDTTRLAELGSLLRRKFDQQANARSEIEERWLDAMLQYHGRYPHDTQVALERDRTGTSRIFVNLTRPRCRSLVARMCETLFPADDRNYEIGPTPNPELAMALPDQVPEVAALEEELAKSAAKAMQREIDDQLVETRYQDKARKAIHWLVMLGTGILKGPIVDARVERTWRALDPVVYELDTQLVRQPAVEAVSPWDFFPDMTATTIEDCEFTFERRYISRKQLRALARNPRYRADAIRAVLREATRTGSYRDPRRQELRALAGNTQGWEDQPYELIEYRGPLEQDDLEALGLGGDLPEHDPLIATEVVVEFIDNYIIRAEIHPLETQEPLYSVVSLIEDETCIFGYGMPDILRSPQAAINAAWRMMLDNAAYSVGPQIVINRQTITGSDGDNTLRPRKIWYLDDPMQPVNQAMAVHNVDMHQPELMSIYLTAKQLIEEESQLPSLMQGEMGQTPVNTATGMSMLSNNAGIIIRETVKQWDERVTKPLIGRFYDFNMQYNDNPAIKGDFKVNARGATALMVKETQAPALMQLATLAQQPGYAPIAKFPEIFRALIETLRLNPETLAKTDEELQIQQQQVAQQASADPALAQQAAEAQQSAALEEEQKQLDYQQHAENIASQERMKVAELVDRKEARQFEAMKLQAEQQRFQQETMLKAATGSGI